VPRALVHLLPGQREQLPDVPAAPGLEPLAQRVGLAREGGQRALFGRERRRALAQVVPDLEEARRVLERGVGRARVALQTRQRGQRLEPARIALERAQERAARLVGPPRAERRRAARVQAPGEVLRRGGKQRGGRVPGDRIPGSVLTAGRAGGRWRS
jgi:hypothetical protein